MDSSSLDNNLSDIVDEEEPSQPTASDSRVYLGPYGEETESIFETIKQLRRQTRRFARNIDDDRPRSGETLTTFMDAFASQIQEYSLTPDQIEWFYPRSRLEPDFSIIDEALQPNVRAEQEFLNKTVPYELPEDSYFEPEEIHALLGLDNTLQYPIKHYISKTSSIL